MIYTKQEMKELYKGAFEHSVIETAYELNIPNPGRQAYEKIVLYRAELRDPNSPYAIRKNEFGLYLEDAIKRVSPLITWEINDNTNLVMLDNWKALVEKKSIESALKKNQISSSEYKRLSESIVLDEDKLPKNVKASGWWF